MEGAAVLRVVACAFLIAASALLPIERPAANAENWQHAGAGDTCVDRDSFGHDAQFAIMTVDNDCSSDPKHEHALRIEGDCSQKPTSAGYTLYAVDPRTGEKVETHAREGGNVITTLCQTDWSMPH